MNQTQRKMHLISWLSLALVLPAGFIAAILVIPEKISQREIYRETMPALPQVITWVSEDNFVAALRVDENKENYQLELIITRPFMAPNLLVYLLSEKGQNIQQQVLLGNIRSKGTLRFALPKAKLEAAKGRIGFFDPLHQKLITTIELKNN